jgi:hypothetical protein
VRQEAREIQRPDLLLLLQQIAKKRTGTTIKEGWGCSSVVESLPSIFKVLGLIHSTLFPQNGLAWRDVLVIPVPRKLS